MTQCPPPPPLNTLLGVTLQMLSDTNSGSLAHYRLGAAGHFKLLQNIFQTSQGLSDLLETGQLQGR